MRKDTCDIYICHVVCCYFDSTLIYIYAYFFGGMSSLPNNLLYSYVYSLIRLIRLISSCSIQLGFMHFISINSLIFCVHWGTYSTVILLLLLLVVLVVLVITVFSYFTIHANCILYYGVFSCHDAMVPCFFFHVSCILTVSYLSAFHNLYAMSAQTTIPRALNTHTHTHLTLKGRRQARRLGGHARRQIGRARTVGVPNTRHSKKGGHCLDEDRRAAAATGRGATAITGVNADALSSRRRSGRRGWEASIRRAPDEAGKTFTADQETSTLFAPPGLLPF